MNSEEKSRNGYLFQFDSYCRKVVKFNGCATRRNEKRRERRTLDCIAFDEAILEMLYVEDKYRVLLPKIDLSDLSVHIEDENLYYHLQRLPRKRLEIILLSYFLELSDHEIGKRMRLAKSTVQHNRRMALLFLQTNMRRVK